MYYCVSDYVNNSNILVPLICILSSSTFRQMLIHMKQKQNLNFMNVLCENWQTRRLSTSLQEVLKEPSRSSGSSKTSSARSFGVNLRCVLDIETCPHMPLEICNICPGMAKPLKHGSRTGLSLSTWNKIGSISACSKFLPWTVTDKCPTLWSTSYLCANEPIAGSVRGVPSKMRKLALCECRQMVRLSVALVTPNYTMFTAGTTDQFSHAALQVLYIQWCVVTWREYFRFSVTNRTPFPADNWGRWALADGIEQGNTMFVISSVSKIFISLNFIKMH